MILGVSAPRLRRRPAAEPRIPLRERMRGWSPPWRSPAGEVVTEDTVPPIRVPHVPVDGDRVYVWDLVVRATHWIIVLAMLVLVVTGLYIGSPFLVTDAATTGGLTMAWIKIIHSYAAIAFTLAVAARVIWMFTGTQYARWSQLVPLAPDRWKKIKGTLSFYLLIRRHPPPAVGHNPLAGLTYIAVFGLYFLMIATGFALFAISAHVGSHMRWFDFLLPVFGGAQGARWVHHVVMWLLIGFAIHHVFSALLFSLVEKNGTIDSIFSGYKTIRRAPPPPAERDG